MASLVEGSLKEDVLEYRIHFTLPAELTTEQDISRCLDTKRDHVLAFLSRFCANYVWQVEPFGLRVIGGTNALPAHLGGNTCYGDNVEDEWFIVALLIEVSKEFLDTIISVQDNDGEFLLIEAADHLPSWLKPDTAENRIFIHKGKIHIVPRSCKVSCANDGINYVRQNFTATIAAKEIQEVIKKRISGYPQKSQESLHTAHCYLPASLAAALDLCPALVAPIVQAFYHRDPLDLKACVTFKHFRPGTRVLRQVLFTRCLYAQLLQQKFSPDRRSGYTLPPSSNPKFKAHDLGMKLAHGAEILCSKYNIDEVTASDSDKSFKASSRWQRFVSALEVKGYFKGELEGSKLYRKLYDDAVQYYKSSVASQRSDSEDVGRRILGLIKSANFDMEEMRRQESSLPPADDDSWINITSEQLDELLNNACGKYTPSTVTDLSKVAERMKAFVENISSHEGVEFPGNDDDETHADSTGFIQNMQKMFEFDDPDSASSSDMDEYESEDDLDEAYPPARSKHATPSNGTQKPSSKPTPTEKPKTSSSGGKGDGSKKSGSATKMQDYMDAMDQELAKTTIGKSFVQQESKNTSDSKPKPPPRRRKPNSSAILTPNNTPIMSTLNPPGRCAQLDESIDDEDDDFRPVNVDLNTVQNLLESYESQRGLPGPASNILGGMGMRLPPSSGKR